MNNNKNIIIIQKWWKKYTTIVKLRNIYEYIKNKLTKHELQDLSNKCYSINNFCKGDGCGLIGGILIDMFISQYFKNKFDNYEECHNGECDMKINNIPISLKKINGKSNLSLDWSKNKNNKIKTFYTHIMIINLKTEKWWRVK